MSSTANPPSGHHPHTSLGHLRPNNSVHIKNSQDFANKVRSLKLDSDETMVSYEVTSLFAIKSVRERLLQDSTLPTEPTSARITYAPC